MGVGWKFGIDLHHGYFLFKTITSLGKTRRNPVFCEDRSIFYKLFFSHFCVILVTVSVRNHGCHLMASTKRKQTTGIFSGGFTENLLTYMQTEFCLNIF